MKVQFTKAEITALTQNNAEIKSLVEAIFKTELAEDVNYYEMNPEAGHFGRTEDGGFEIELKDVKSVELINHCCGLSKLVVPMVLPGLGILNALKGMFMDTGKKLDQWAKSIKGPQVRFLDSGRTIPKALQGFKPNLKESDFKGNFMNATFDYKGHTIEYYAVKGSSIEFQFVPNEVAEEVKVTDVCFAWDEAEGKINGEPVKGDFEVVDDYEGMISYLLTYEVLS